MKDLNFIVKRALLNVDSEDLEIECSPGSVAMKDNLEYYSGILD